MASDLKIPSKKANKTKNTRIKPEKDLAFEARDINRIPSLPRQKVPITPKRETYTPKVFQKPKTSREDELLLATERAKARVEGSLTELI